MLRNTKTYIHENLNEDPPPHKRKPRLRTLKTLNNYTPQQEIAVTILFTVLEDLNIAKHYKNLKEYKTYKLWKSKKAYKEALDYIEQDDEKNPLSFSNICYSLNIDPEGTKRSIYENLRNRKV